MLKKVAGGLSKSGGQISPKGFSGFVRGSVGHVMALSLKEARRGGGFSFWCLAEFS